MAASTAVLTSALVKFAMVIVLIAPVPEAVTPAPTKLSVSAAVDNDEPSSCTVIAAAPPETVIVLVVPVPLATTPAPTKLITEAAVDKFDPSSCIVIAVPPPPPV